MSRRLLLPLALSLALGLVLAARPEARPAPRSAQSRREADPRRAALNVLVPAYFYPVAGSPWDRLTQTAGLHPGRVGAIGDPFNGPGPSFDPTYDAAFRAFRAAGGRLIGYVYTSYGNRSAALVKADIDSWYSWYELDGIFLDEMDNVPGAHESYYLDLADHVRMHQAQAWIVGNPGSSTSPGYLFQGSSAVTSALCIYEGGSGFLAWQNDPWTEAYARRHFYALPYNTGGAGWQAAVDHAWSNHCGLVYVTDDVLPNPWDTLPAYFESMVQYVATNY